MKLPLIKPYVSEEIYQQLYDFGAEFGLNTDLRLAYFMANCDWESGHFKKFEENLNYSAQALANTWPTKFSINPKAKDKEPNKLALQIQRRPELIGAYAYGSRMGNSAFIGLNGASQSDGYKYRGRGAVQLTGKNNYKAFGQSIGIDLVGNPDLVKTHYPITSALWFFHTNGIFQKVKDKSIENQKTIRKAINGGLSHFLEVKELFEKYCKILNI